MSDANTGHRNAQDGPWSIAPGLPAQGLAGAVLVAALGALAFLIDHFLSRPPADPFGATCGALALITLAFLAARTLFVRVDIDRDGLALRRPFGTTRLRRNDILGYRRRYSSATRATDLVIETRAGDSVVIPHVVRRRVERDTWVGELTDLKDQDRQREKKAWERDTRWGEDAATRRAKAARWEKRCIVLNVIAGMLCAALWLPDSMETRGYWALLMMLASLPAIAMIVSWFTYGAVDLLFRKENGYLSVGVLMLTPVMLAWRALDWTLIDAWQPWMVAAVSAIPLSNLLTKLTQVSDREFGGRWIGLFVLCVLWIGSGLVLTNVRHDRTPPDHYEATVTSSKARSSYRGRRNHSYGRSFARVSVGPWALDSGGSTLRTLYDYPRGYRCTVNVHRGALRLRWIDLESCVDPTATVRPTVAED